MKRYLQLMGVLMILQLIVSAMVLWPKSSAESADKVFYDVDAATINTIEIADMQNNVVRLNKTSKGWIVEQNAVVAEANEQQVESLLKALTQQPAGWPVTTTEDAWSRFAVADDDYQWKLSVSSENLQKKDVLLVGTSINNSKRHIRHAENSSVFALNFSFTDRYVSNKDWIKRDVLALSTQSIEAINASDYNLIRVTNEWRLADQHAEENVDQTLVQTLISRLSNFTVEEFVTGSVLDSLKNEKPVQTLKVKTSSDKNQSTEWVYDFYKLTEKTYAKRRDIEIFYEISLLTASEMLKIRTQWLKAADQSKPDVESRSSTNNAPLTPEEITGFER